MYFKFIPKIEIQILSTLHSYHNLYLLCILFKLWQGRILLHLLLLISRIQIILYPENSINKKKLMIFTINVVQIKILLMKFSQISDFISKLFTYDETVISCKFSYN